MKNPSRFMKFIGGRDLFYGLILLILIGVTIFLYHKISFIFHPFIVIFATVAPPVILAFIAYYLMNPIVNLLERFRIKRIWGIIIIILGISGLLTGLVLLTAPAIETQVKGLIQNFPSYLTQMGEGIQSFFKRSFLDSYYEQGYEWLITTLGDIPNQIGDYVGKTYESVVNIANTVTQVVVVMITFPIILFFLLKDSAQFKEYILRLLPPKLRGKVNQILVNMDVQVGSYIRGQIIVATCIGILLFIGYSIIGLDYAITLAIIAAVTSVVPYLGPTIAISPAIIIAIVEIGRASCRERGEIWVVVDILNGK